MIEIRKPTSINKNDFYMALFGINSLALIGVEGRDKGGVDPHFIARWDETIAPVPTDAEMIVGSDTVQLNKAKIIKQIAIDGNFGVAEDVPVTLGGFDFDANTKALTEAMSVVVAVAEGYTLPSGFTWIDAAGVARPTDAAGIKSLFGAISIKHYQDAHNYAKLTKQVKAATTSAEVALIADW